MALKIATLNTRKPEPPPPVIDTGDIIADAIETAQAENAKVIKALMAEIASLKDRLAVKKQMVSVIERDKQGRIISVTTEIQEA